MAGCLILTCVRMTTPVGGGGGMVLKRVQDDGWGRVWTRRRYPNALNVISVKVSFTPGRVWTCSVTKRPMS